MTQPALSAANQGLIGWWQLAQTEGTSAVNQITTRPSGTLMNGVTWVIDAERGPVAEFDGVDDRSAAESLVRAILWIDQDQSAAVEDDAWYDHQLTGLDVVRDGDVVGRVIRVDHFPAQDLLVVRPVHGEEEILVPFVSAIVPVVDIAGGRVEVTPPAGLFEALPDEEQGDKPVGDETASGSDATED